MATDEAELPDPTVMAEAGQLAEAEGRLPYSKKIIDHVLVNPMLHAKMRHACLGSRMSGSVNYHLSIHAGIGLRKAPKPKGGNGRARDFRKVQPRTEDRGGKVVTIPPWEWVREQMAEQLEGLLGELEQTESPAYDRAAAIAQRVQDLAHARRRTDRHKAVT